MENQRFMMRFTILTIMLVVAIGFISSCGDRSGENEGMNSDSTRIGATPGSQTQRMTGEANAGNQQQEFEATLKGSNEVPQVNSDASGSATVTLRGDSIHIKGSFSGLSADYTASHIHKGAKGENGKPIQPLDPQIDNNKTSGSWDASYELDDSQLSALKSGNLYINVHSTKHKSGEIRGQLTASGSGM